MVNITVVNINRCVSLWHICNLVNADWVPERSVRLQCSVTWCFAGDGYLWGGRQDFSTISCSVFMKNTIFIYTKYLHFDCNSFKPLCCYSALNILFQDLLGCFSKPYFNWIGFQINNPLFWHVWNGERAWSGNLKSEIIIVYGLRCLVLDGWLKKWSANTNRNHFIANGYFKSRGTMWRLRFIRGWLVSSYTTEFRLPVSHFTVKHGDGSIILEDASL